MTPPALQPGHDCNWVAYAHGLEQVVAEQKREIEALRAAKFADKRKSEQAAKPPADASGSASATDSKPKVDPEESRRKRAEAAERRATADITEEVVEEKIEVTHKICTACGEVVDRELPPEESVTYDYVLGHFVRRRHQRQRLACRCGGCIITAKAAPKVIDRSRYGPALISHVIISKCLDALPLYPEPVNDFETGHERFYWSTGTVPAA